MKRFWKSKLLGLFLGLANLGVAIIMPYHWMTIVNAFIGGLLIDNVWNRLLECKQ